MCPGNSFKQLNRLEFGILPLISLHQTTDDLIVSASYSKDTINRSGSVFLFDTKMNKVFEEPLSSASFHTDYIPEHDIAVIKLADGKIGHFKTRERSLAYERIDNEGIMITDVSYLPSDMTTGIFTDAKGKIVVFNRESEKIILRKTAHELFGNEVSAWCCMFLNDNTYVTGGDDCLLKIFDIRSNDVAMISRVHDGGVVRIREAWQPMKIITGAYDNHLRMLDVRNLGSVENSVELKGDPWDYKIQKNGSLSVACMYSGWYLLDQDFSINSHQELPDSLVYGIECVETADDIRVICSSFTNGSVFIFERSNGLVSGE